MTPRSHLRTSDLARAVGIHPNTVRLYEAWGLIPPVPRSPSGYRLFSEVHLDTLRLARTALHGGWPGKNIRESAITLVHQAAAGELEAALEQARQHVGLVQVERAQAEAAAEFLEQWARGITPGTPDDTLRIGEAAALLGLSVDMLRSWERDGLTRVPRDPVNGYRRYGPAEIGRLRVIRMLRRSGYSTMAILRMLLSFDQGQGRSLREVLDTPRPDEDVYSAADRWLSTLEEHAGRAAQLVEQLEAMIRKRAG